MYKVSRSQKSLADTPTGRPRRALSRRAKIVWCALFGALAARTMYGLLPPSLSPEQVAALDGDARYARWQASAEGAGFERLRVAATTVHRDSSAIGHCLEVLQSDKPETAAVEVALADARQLTAKHADALKVMRQSVTAPYANPPWRSVNELVPYFSDFRTVARLNALQAEVQRRDGDKDGAADSLATGMQFGAHIMKGSNIIGRLVGIAAQSISARPLWQLLPTLSPTGSAQVLPRLEAATQPPPIAETLDEEERLGQRMLLQIWGDRRGGKGISISPLFNLTSLIWPHRTVWSGHNGYIDAWKKLASGPYRPEQHPPLPSDLLNRILLPAYDGLHFRHAQQSTENALLLESARVYVYRAQQGSLPASLAVLGMPPCDPFGANTTLLYRPSGDQFVLYSVGPDGRDDGGKPIKNADLIGSEKNRKRQEVTVQPTSKGDFVAGVNL